MRKIFLLLVILFVPVFAWADGSPLPSPDCNEVCNGDPNYCGPIPCKVENCVAKCESLNPTPDCAAAQCHVFWDCICAALGSPLGDDDNTSPTVGDDTDDDNDSVDDDTAPSNGGSPTHHHSGCGIVAANADLSLFLVMTAIGLFAFVYGRRTK